MAEKIGVTYRQVGRLPAYHMALFYERADGKRSVIQATSLNADFMDGGEQKDALADEYWGRPNPISPFGRLFVQSERRWDDSRDVRADNKKPYRILAEGDDLSGAWERIRDTARDVNKTGYWYRALSQNSNTFAAAAAERAGIQVPNGVAIDPILGTVHVYPAFGFDKPLSETIAPYPASLSPGMGDDTPGEDGSSAEPAAAAWADRYPEFASP